MGETVLTAEQVEAKLSGVLRHWHSTGAAIVRRYKTPDWRATLMLVNAIGYAAESAWHHPDLAVSYASVEVTLSTHSAGGITAKDLAMADQIERLATARPADLPAEAPPLTV